MLRPTAKEVTALENYKLLIKFDNDEVRTFNVKNLLSFKPFKPFEDKAVFRTARPNGITVEWINDIDICPDELYYDSVPLGDSDWYSKTINGIKEKENGELVSWDDVKLANL